MPQTESSAAKGQSDSNALLERFCLEVQAEWKVSLAGIYEDFAIEVAKRAVLAEREACANIARGAHIAVVTVDDFNNGWASAALQIEQAIRMRSN